ncbi:MAG: hypothetical protein QOG01_669 [Pseudonocardiales bacterium]|jgi:hypothetical protein|nr:hypothetical protein [Pseudonocardiales bacterium]
MTAVTAAPSRPARRLGGLWWVTWRQHRFVMLGVVVLLAALGTLLVVNGIAMHNDYHRLGLDTCGSTQSRQCNVAFEIFNHRYVGIVQFLPRVLLFIPALLGAFVGAPLVARELETGTFRFAWTQGTNRVRWVVAKLVLLAGGLAVLGLAFSMLFTWWFHLWIPYMGRMQSGQAYELEGTVFTARILFGFALGAFLGALIRRTVPAMAATLALWVGVVLPSVLYLRPLIQTPVIARDSTDAVTRNGWTIESWFQDQSGKRISGQTIDNVLRSEFTTPQQAKTGGLDQLLAKHGYTAWVKYQPDGRFWHFQIVETAAYVALTLLLGSATVWWVRRRTT